jgi:hypothetical protein
MKLKDTQTLNLFEPAPKAPSHRLKPCVPEHNPRVAGVWVGWANVQEVIENGLRVRKAWYEGKELTEVVDELVDLADSPPESRLRYLDPEFRYQERVDRLVAKGIGRMDAEEAVRRVIEEKELPQD